MCQIDKPKQKQSAVKLNLILAAIAALMWKKMIAAISNAFNEFKYLIDL